MDREKVIRIIDELIFEAQKAPTWKAENALRCLKKELLKEQEAVEPKCKERMGGFVVGLCPMCGMALNNVHNVKACGKCGQAVKWN